MKVRQWEIDDFYRKLNDCNENVYHLSKLFHFDHHYFKKLLRENKVVEKNWYNCNLYLNNQIKKRVK